MAALALLAITLAASITPHCTGDVTVERTAYLMGTLLRLEVRGSDRGCTLAATEAVLAEVARMERMLSSWDSASEVGRLNAAVPGTPVPLSVELAGMLAEVRRYTTLTGGAFDPGVGVLVAAWDLRGAGRVPTPVELAGALAQAGIARLLLDGADRTAVRPSVGWWVDTGAFGKGAALRSAAAVLRRHGVRDALLDFGGQLLVLGRSREVAVADPRARGTAMPERLRLAGMSVSTTSSSERFVAVTGARHGHVLDPRTGRPVPAWGSVSVVAADALAADALSTALFVLGPEAALAWAAEHGEYGVLVQEVRGDRVVVRASASLLSFLESTRDHGVTIQ